MKRKIEVGELFNAVTCNNIRLIKELIKEKRVNVNMKNEDGWTAVMYAIVYDYEHTNCIRALIKAGADVNAKDKDGFTPLMIASMYGHIDCIRELIKAGANVNLKNKNGETALMIAEKYGYTNCVKELKRVLKNKKRRKK